MIPINTKSSNDFQTPPEALLPLLPYLKKEWMIWECAEGKGNLSGELRSKGHVVWGSDKYNIKYKNMDNVFFEYDMYDINDDDLHDDCKYMQDFLTYEPDFHYDCIVTNPPYSLKTEFLERCYELGKPFALLMPLTTLETDKRQKLFKKYGIQVILFNKRINFEMPSGKGSSSWFATAWFASGLNLPEQLNFVEIGKIDSDQQKLF